MIDASPQKGVELFIARELVIVGGDVDLSRERDLPLGSLGFGRMGQRGDTAWTHRNCFEKVS